MLNIPQSLIIVVLTVAGSLLFMWGLNKVWPWDKRHAHNDLIGWQLSILGTTYAVMLGFMLYTVWTDFGAAELNVDNEASALASVFRLAQGLPEEERGQLQMQARYYANTVINKDWPDMAADFTPEASAKIDQSVAEDADVGQKRIPTELLAEDHAISELSALSEHRRIRPAAEPLPTARSALVRSNYRRSGHDRIGFHVRLRKYSASRASGIGLFAVGRARSGRGGRHRSALRRFRARQRSRFPASPARDEGLANYGVEAICFSESAIALRKASTAGTDGDSSAFFAE